MSRFNNATVFVAALLVSAAANASGVTLIAPCDAPAFTANATDKTIKITCPGAAAPFFTMTNCSNPTVVRNKTAVVLVDNPRYTVSVVDHAEYAITCN
jgi:hypothetical protein